jgi:inosine-uridine nucleoside N-ribohydrolase
MTELEPTLTDAELADRLAPPVGADEVSMVLDTDADNEIDDQFAVAYALGSSAVTVEALYAAPFDNDRSNGPEDGMERSYVELGRLLDRMPDGPDADRIVFEGSRSYLPGAGDPVESPAATDLVSRAHASEDPLYVVAIGCPTNVAAAILDDPAIREEIAVVWLGGHPHDWRTAREFNLRQDRHATRVLLDSGVPLAQIPCRNVAEHVKTTVPELRAHLSGRSELADYLVETFADYPAVGDRWGSKEIWDLAAVAWVADPDLVPSHLTHSPVLGDHLRWSTDRTRHLMRVAHGADRDAILRAMAEVV